MEANYADPLNTLRSSLNDGFVRVNDATEQRNLGGETPIEDETKGFYTEADLPFYYTLAQTFAISDRCFAALLGPTFPNRAYALAATSFGHLNTAEQFPPPGGYKPVNGTILDLLDRAQCLLDKLRLRRAVDRKLPSIPFRAHPADHTVLHGCGDRPAS